MKICGTFSVRGCASEFQKLRFVYISKNYAKIPRTFEFSKNSGIFKAIMASINDLSEMCQALFDHLKCELCGNKFGHKQGLEYHIQSHQVQNRPRDFKCDIQGVHTSLEH